MKRRVLIGATLALGAALALAAGASASRSVLPSSSCGPVKYKGSGKPQVLIASDLPLQGSGRSQTVQMTKAVNYILGLHGYKVGKWTVGYQSCDDATPQAGKWDSGKVSANAQAYAADKTVVGVIGTFNSGASAIMIPILNRAAGGSVAMVSPANTYVGLTHAGPGTAPGEPGKYYPTGKRNYVRVVAADIRQGTADALLLKSKGITSVYILNDKESYGLGIANDMRNGSKANGLKIAGFAAWDPNAASYQDLATKIQSSGAKAVFLGGLECENGGKLIKDLRAGLGASFLIVAPDGFSSFKDTVAHAGDAAEGMIISIAGQPYAQLGKGGKAFANGFGKSVGLKAKDVNPYSNYGATAALTLLKAVASSDGTRASVTANLFKTSFTDSPVGAFKLDKNGDTNAAPISFYTIKGGQAVFTKLINPAK